MDNSIYFRILCRKHINPKKEKDQKLTDFWFVQGQALGKGSLKEGDKKEGKS